MITRNKQANSRTLATDNMHVLSTVTYVQRKYMTLHLIKSSLFPKMCVRFTTDTHHNVWIDNGQDYLATFQVPVWARTRLCETEHKLDAKKNIRGARASTQDKRLTD